MQNTTCPKCLKPGNLLSGHFPGSKEKQLIMEHGPHDHCLLDRQIKETEIPEPLAVPAEPSANFELDISENIKLPPFACIWMRDIVYAKLMGYSIKMVKDSCNPNKDAHYSSEMFHPMDVRKFGKGFEIRYNPSLIDEENRPRILTREKRPRPGNPNLRKRNPLRGIPKASKPLSISDVQSPRFQ